MSAETSRPEQSGGPDARPDSVYYQHSGSLPLASRLSYTARQRIFARFMQIMKPLSHETVLDIGVTNDIRFKESNFFEQFYPYRSQLLCVGTEDGSHLESLFPGVRFRPVVPGAPLPFADKQFDIVFSNAVIEHVGNTCEQRAFVREACRVGKRVFMTTPNRWFPVEHHTGVPFVHYLPKALHRLALRRTKFAYWSHEAHLNLLTRSEFEAIFPPEHPVEVAFAGVGIGPFCSNLVAYTAPSRSQH
jgi:SAM-dependent methyltransferase